MRNTATAFGRPASLRDLIGLSEMERALQDVCLAGERPRIELNWNSRVMVIAGSRRIVARIGRPLLHQLGGRALNLLAKEVATHAENWTRDLGWWREVLTIEKIEAALRREDVILRLLPCGADFGLYGVISPRFRRTDKLALRAHFLAKSKLHRMEGDSVYSIDRFGAVYERIGIRPSPDSRFGLEAVLRYGLDNGYSACRMLVGRRVLICSNGLTRVEYGTDLEWRHNAGSAVEELLDRAFEWALAEGGRLEERSKIADSRPLDGDALLQLVQRASAATASVQRALDRLDIDIRQSGRNEWSLSQALTWMGAHDRALPRPEVFTRLGTEVLEQGLTNLLQESVIDSRSRALMLSRETACANFRQLADAPALERRCRAFVN